MNTSGPAAPTFAVVNPSDSILVHLARVALAPGASGGVAAWPRLDLSDAAQRQFGDYELLQEIGRGGMGVVYRARQRSLEREVAIKFIADWFADGANITRFLAEARAAARLLHPNIVSVHEVGSVEGVHYFSMPLIEGRSLAQVLDDGPMPANAVLGLMLKLCEAIEYAHRLGLLHLDLKPANVLIDAREEPLIADFGLARHMDDRGGVDAQEVSGTPSFMAPEQILIKQYRLTRATDIYALGAILYLCLTGQSPHGEGAADDVLRRAVAGRVRPPRELNPKISRDLDAICMKCLELQPSDRYASAAELADDLRRVRDGLPVSVRRISFAERVQRWFRREPKLAAAATLAVLALAIGGAATTWQWKQAAAERDRATIAGEIGAHLFSYSGDANDRARDLIEWLRKRLPGNEQRQADALATFASSVNDANQSKTEELLTSVTEVLGVDYRRQMIAALERSSDKYRHLYAAVLAWGNISKDEKETSQQFTIQLQKALADLPEDPRILETAAVYCAALAFGEDCPSAKAAATLVRVEPDNAFSWLLLLLADSTGSRAREALHEAATRPNFDDNLGTGYETYARAFEVAAISAPALIAHPARVLAPDERPESNLALLEGDRIPLPSYQHLVAYCGVKVDTAVVTDPEILSDCLTIGERLMRSHGAIITQMIGVALVKTLAKDTPLADEATQTRRLYAYLSDMTDRLSPSQRMSYPSSRYIKDIATAGEMAALQRRLQFLGIADDPPHDWKPEDPLALQSSRERYENAVRRNHDAGVLVASGSYAEAVALLAPAENIMRKRFGKNWLVSRYFWTLGRARLGLGQYSLAQTNLQAAWDISRDFGPKSQEAIACATALFDLYNAWDIAEKGKGYDNKASEWRRTLADFESPPAR